MATREMYRVNSPRVIFESIDGELIMVHMEKGAYYTTDEVGAVLWEMIEAGHSVDGMCRALETRYEASAREIGSAVLSFIERLIAEELITRAEPAGDAAAFVPPPAGPRGHFRAPQLHSYRDMQDMLALDPIHDVEAAGWPVPKADDGARLESETA